MIDIKKTIEKSKEAMQALESKVSAMLENDCFDEREDGVLRKYLCNIYSQMDTHEILYVQDTDDYGLEVRWASRNNDEEFFSPFSVLTLEQAKEVYKQVAGNKGRAKERNISIIRQLFISGYDVPYNFSIKPINKHIITKVDDGTYKIGEVGLSCNDNGMCLSVFFPDKTNPTFSLDTELSEMEYSDLVAIGDAMGNIRTNQQ